ncbi:ABC transporter substrate-binding protein [Virgibacillus profundi]|uniref:ABC transporter substrate-binding protein n=1 Tax=Virgibacillus profundi TaxID=2024555 RepID=A0A2A2IJA9_9BACI|nr:extracellular solute-binding protein [Virgibacillus profundi]PAV31240.1 ABC transporter substrate-binding protein [Virgibacillus profundi]PXY55425.1 ABC transporter substrate-binding protein [Virgibacillus profundi]
MNIKKIFSLLLFIAILTGCSDSAEPEDVELDEEQLANLNETGFPIVDEQITLDIFAGKSPATNDDWNDVLIFNKYQEMTNIDINWEMVPVEGLSEKRNIRLAGDTLPDVFHSARFSFADLQTYGSQGMFISLNDLIEDYAPNLSSLFESHPDVKKAITMPDGNIYSLPYLFDPEFTSVLVASRPWIREDWLQQLEMDNPETMEEYYQFLKAVKETDLNGNGEADEIPFGGTSMARLTNWLKGSFGLQNKGMKHGYVDMDPNEEQLRFFPIADEYREMLEYINKLYSEGLIEENIYSIDTTQYLANASEGVYASTDYYSPDMLFGEEVGNKYIPANALEGPDGIREYSNITSPVMQPGAFVITSENENPAATIRWADHFYGDEGAELFFMGIEGETFETDEEGNRDYVDEIENNPDGLSMEQAVSQYLTYPGGFYPALVKEEFFIGSENTEMSWDAVETLEPYMIEEVWPEFTFTDEEGKTMNTLGADMHKYVNEMTDKFVTGEVPFSEWDNYVETIKDMNLEKYMEIQQAAYERFKK